MALLDSLNDAANLLLVATGVAFVGAIAVIVVGVILGALLAVVVKTLAFFLD